MQPSRVVLALTVALACPSRRGLHRRRRRPEPAPAVTGADAPAKPVKLTFGVWGSRAPRSRRTRASSTPTTPSTDEATVEIVPVRRPAPRSRPRSTAATCPTCSSSRAATCAALRADDAEPPGRRPARRARRRLRRRLLPRRARGLRRRPRAAVHAVRHLADGHLLQHARSSTSTDGRARPAGAQPGRGRGATLRSRCGTSTDVRGRGRVRHPPAQGHRGLLRRPHAARPRAVHLLRRRRALRRRRDPTSLAFSSDDTRAALETCCRCCATPSSRSPPSSWPRRRAEQWFEAGKLGMIAGFRSLAPELRAVPGLDFDVMPMPIVDDAATVGDITGHLPRQGHPRPGRGGRLPGPLHLRRVGGPRWPRRATWPPPTSGRRSPTTSCSPAGARALDRLQRRHQAACGSRRC